MGAPTKDETRTFPNGIQHQYLAVSISARTVDADYETVGEDAIKLTLYLDPTQTAYDAAGIENAVIKALNNAQGQLATARGEAGV